VAKLNLLLLLVLVVCALGLVTSQHKARTLFSELERAEARARELDVEYGKLQLEASTWGLHARIERVAAGTLGMHVPDARRVRVIGAGEAQ
jgi:cell division protein FtsL